MLVAFAAVDKFLTVFPVIVAVPLELTIPLITFDELAELGTLALFIFAIVLLVMEMVAELLLFIPVMIGLAVTVAAVLALILFVVAELPIEFPLIVNVVPADVAIPVKPIAIEVVLPIVVIEPIILLDMFETVLVASVQIP